MDPRTKSQHVGKFAMVKGAKAFAEGTADSVCGLTVVGDHTLKVEMAFPAASSWRSLEGPLQATGCTSCLSTSSAPSQSRTLTTMISSWA